MWVTCILNQGSVCASVSAWTLLCPLVFFPPSLCQYTGRLWHPTPALLPGNSHGQRSLVGCSLWGREESDTTERLPFHFSLSCSGEGNGHPLQGSCLESPRGGGAWWAAVYGAAQSRTRLKRLSSSSSSASMTAQSTAASVCLVSGNASPLLCSCLEEPMDRGVWRDTVHGVAKSQTQLSG